MNRCIPLLLIALWILVPLASNADEQEIEDAKKQAVEVAEAWLALIDQGKYDDGWETAAAYLKNAVSKEEFVKSLTAARKPLGNVITRKLSSKHYRTSLPGAPDGEYVVIQFETSFENKKEALETITPMLDKDKTWKVSGYFIK